MNTILATVTSRYNLPSCWLYEDRQYQIEGEIKYKLQMKLRNLPWVETEHEGILQEQGISYRKVTTQNTGIKTFMKLKIFAYLCMLK